MNVYDFDKTIYAHDSTADFFKFCIKRRPSLLRYAPKQLFWAAAFALGYDKTKFKEKFYCFFRGIKDVDALLEEFWDGHMGLVHKWYLEKRRPDDLVISASPEFLVAPALRRLGSARLIASVVDKRTGKYTGKNCHGEEKVRRLRLEYPEAEIEEFYSDSFSDAPLALISKRAFLVSGEDLTPWDEAKKKARR